MSRRIYAPRFRQECSLLPRWERSTTTGITPKCRSCGEQREKNLEARVGIEPTHKGFADPVVTLLSPFHSILSWTPSFISSAFCPPDARKIPSSQPERRR